MHVNLVWPQMSIDYSQVMFASLLFVYSFYSIRSSTYRYLMVNYYMVTWNDIYFKFTFHTIQFFSRWRFVIHGGIDGYSRIPVFLRCASNNRAETMLSSFQRGVLDFGLPAKVRSDKGGENILVCSFMMNHPLRGPESKPFITGRSVHNQRIERLWRDVFTVGWYVLQTFL